jgi:hypothetical protein
VNRKFRDVCTISQGLIYRVGQPNKYFVYIGLFLFAVGLRVAAAVSISYVSGVSLRNLALFYDGHMYLIVAKTIPEIYSNVTTFFPEFSENPAYVTGWFPVYPILISFFGLMTGDLRLSALIVAWSAGGIAVVLFYELAKEYMNSPFFAAILFSFLPPAWLIGGSLALVESTYVCILLAFFLSFKRDWPILAALFAALTMLTQKSGFLILPILIFAARPLKRAIFPFISAIVAAVVLQMYLWWLFGDPLMNIKAQSAAFGSGSGFFGLPFAGYLKGLLSSGNLFSGLFWTRKIIIFIETAFYIGTILWAWRNTSQRMSLLTVWLSIVLLFYASLTGIFSFYAFPRYMTMACPAAIILACQLSPSIGRWKWDIAALLLIFTMLWTVMDALDAMELVIRRWSPEYFNALLSVLNS